jgi:N utilization substance protein B
MGARSSGREVALQMLFALEGSLEADTAELRSQAADRIIGWFWREVGPSLDEPLTPESRAWADEAVRGVAGDVDKLDETIRAASTNWRLERMARVDRNVLRLGAWELMRRSEVPRAVVLDEAVELAKRFGSEDSGSFVNGVLDRIADDLGRSS